MSCFSKFLVAAGLLQSAFASPTLIHVPAQRAAHLQERQTSDAALLNSLVNIITKADPAAGLSLSGLVTDILGGIGDDLHEANLIFSALLTAIEDTVAAQVTATPTDIPAASSALSSILAATPTILYEQIFEVIENGLVTDKLASEVNALVTASFSGMNSKTNVNPAPTCTIYPQKNCTDAPYNLTEDQLRQVIYIPATFTYGKVPPVILVPGTGNTGYQTFAGNYIPLLQGSTIADPVWLNIPGQLLMDVQVNAEYVAYAINYISCITNKNVSVISWSQGGLDTQWALKYWPSTRQVTSDFIPMSPDFHGTVLAYILCPAFPMLPCAPAVIQQEYNSNFIATIRNNGGNSAYVPTTTVFSSTDEIVQPQSPVTGASAFLLDARNVGVTNNQVQAVCGGRGPAGTFYTHEGVLYNPLGYALVIDALTHAGPGRTSRIDLTTVCAQIVSPGLDLIDVLTTEESIVLAGLSVVLYPAKQINEPAIMSYAVAGATVGANCTTSSTSGSASRTTSTSSGRSTVLTVSVDVTVTSTQRTSLTSSSTTSSSRSTSTKSTVAASASAVIVLPFSSPVMKTIAGSGSMTIVVLPTTPVIKARETTVLECDGAECGSTAHQAAVTSHSAMTSNTESYEYTVNETTTVLAFSTPAVPSHWHGHHSNFTKTPKLGGHSIKNGAPRKPENTIPSFSESTASFTFASSAPATTAAPEVVYSSTGYRVNEDGSYDFGNENEKLDSGVQVQYITHTVLVDA
ncbi:putative lipase b precursor [Venturia nashicola]|uniref:Putative lipase b n=1 Tax=Venturia nashicola TaxID=86259 RepID=A0A4Z1NQ92_9PEZI|nr:putative lipase b precursor [Venturia nashicola]